MLTFNVFKVFTFYAKTILTYLGITNDNNTNRGKCGNSEELDGETLFSCSIGKIQENVM